VPPGCRTRHELGYALFGEITDILRANPNIATGFSRAEKSETPEQGVKRISRYAYLGARPRPVHLMIQTTPFGEQRGICRPGELRRRAYTIVGAGTKGALLWHHEWDSDDPAARAVEKEIKLISAELEGIREYLAIADSVPWIEESETHGLLASALLAGDEALILVVVRKTRQEDAPVPGHKETALRIAIPPVFLPERILHVTSNGLKAIDRYSLEKRENGRYILRLPFPVDAAAYLLPIRRAAE